MERALEREGGRLLGVLEGAVRSLELLAIVPTSGRALSLPAAGPASDTLRALSRLLAVERSLLTAALAEPEDAAGPDADDGELGWRLDAELAAQALPSSLHAALRCLSSDRPARDALRAATSSSVSPAVARLALGLSQLAMHSERALATSAEQDKRSAVSLRESRLRLCEAEDDRQQVGFELAQERDARLLDAARASAQAAALETQLRELSRGAHDALAGTRRERETELQAARSAFETQQSAAGDQRAAVERGAQRIGDVRVQREADERKRTAAASAELRELLARYDADCAALDERVAAETRELRRVDEAARAIALRIERVDADRAAQLDEQQALERAERARRLREMNVFRFVQRVQAVARGFLARRRLRLELAATTRRRRRRKAAGNKSPGKKTKPGKRASGGSKTA